MSIEYRMAALMADQLATAITEISTHTGETDQLVYEKIKDCTTSETDEVLGNIILSDTCDAEKYVSGILDKLDDIPPVAVILSQTLLRLREIAEQNRLTVEQLAVIVNSSTSLEADAVMVKLSNTPAFKDAVVEPESVSDLISRLIKVCGNKNVAAIRVLQSNNG